MPILPNGTPGVSRVTRSREEARTSYNRLSRWYDLIAGGSEGKFREKGLELLNAASGETVLEIGCGTGHSLLALAPQVTPTGHVYGLDLSEGMLAQARLRIKQKEMQNRVSLTCGDAAHIPHPGESFDALFMSFTLELFDTPELPLVLDECRRVLKKNGRISLVSLAKESKTTVRVYEWFHDKFPTTIDCRPIEVGSVVDQAGFRITHSNRLMMWGLPVDVILAHKII
jgi:demethylmenaquinone methyltransferase/2-methoxy-6-polyprenyl-1,4-benzoquinol methylase